MYSTVLISFEFETTDAPQVTDLSMDRQEVTTNFYLSTAGLEIMTELVPSTDLVSIKFEFETTDVPGSDGHVYGWARSNYQFCAFDRPRFV